ncbi:MAG: pyridoxamine 5'-phosphate oxidase family protein [Acidimicrobiales bacterium]
MSNQRRDALRMSDAEVEAFLADGRRVQVATVDAAGGVDLVPMSYLLWDGRLALWTDPGSQKVRNLRRNPAITCLVEQGDRFEEFRAVQLRGRAELIEDPDDSRRAGELLFARAAPGPLTEEGRAAVAALAPQRVVVVVHPERTVSWDHRKLGGVRPGDIGR